MSRPIKQPRNRMNLLLHPIIRLFFPHLLILINGLNSLLNMINRLLYLHLLRSIHIQPFITAHFLIKINRKPYQDHNEGRPHQHDQHCPEIKEISIIGYHSHLFIFGIFPEIVDEKAEEGREVRSEPDKVVSEHYVEAQGPGDHEDQVDEEEAEKASHHSVGWLNYLFDGGEPGEVGEEQEYTEWEEYGEDNVHSPGVRSEGYVLFHV